MSWAPSLMSAAPAGGSRWTISRPVSSKCWMTSSSSPIAVSLADAAQDGFTLGQALVEPVDRARRGLHGGTDAGGAGPSRGLRRRAHGLHAIEQREVELVDAGQDRLVHLHRVEESRVAALGVAQAGGHAVEALARGLDVVDRVEGASARGLVGQLVEGFLVG